MLPFFAATGFRRPHAPYAAAKKYFYLYRSAKIDIPEHLPGYAPGLLPASINYDPPKRRITDPEIRDYLISYYACQSFVDEHRGLRHQMSLFEESARVRRDGRRPARRLHDS